MFDGLCGRRSKWQIWSDFVTLSAISISNVTDKTHVKKREETYMTVAAKYKTEEMQAMAEMLGLIVEGMDKNQDQDFLGELYMALELGNEQNGQFFTPYNVCRMMASITSTELKTRVEQDNWISVSDPASGAGALLIAFANECRRQGVNYQSSVLFIAQDIAYIVGLMCYIQLSLMGCPGYVVIGDSLTHPATSYDERGLIPVDDGNVWYTPFYFRQEWHWRRLAAQMSILCKGQPVAAERAPSDVKAEPVPEQPVIPKKRSRSTGKKKEALPASAVLKETETGQLTLF